MGRGRGGDKLYGVGMALEGRRYAGEERGWGGELRERRMTEKEKGEWKEEESNAELLVS